MGARGRLIQKIHWGSKDVSRQQQALTVPRPRASLKLHLGARALLVQLLALLQQHVKVVGNEGVHLLAHCRWGGGGRVSAERGRQWEGEREG